MNLKDIPLFLYRPLQFLRQIFGGRIVTESARKRKHSPLASDETAASSVLAGTDPDTPRKRLKNDRSGVTSANVQDASANGEHQPPSGPFQATTVLGSAGNHNHSPDASGETAAASVPAGTDQDTQSSIARELSTSGESQTPGRDTPTEFACPICMVASVLPVHIKRLQCSHEFHQSCVDIWLNNRNCPLCRAPQRNVRHRNRRPRANRTHRFRDH
ncbi:hypothetical protein AVEN_87998-1 [Araneus ventricosus]|uniref:RING-type E3 ubiquitin transferase n=1 Tax=Araneus ventricosus TaxID=182803 RepID=A0A4Y2G376_ARAVE|nr:hypothetical protein AVEN_87998-1 [Araneus ventricosus]